MKIVGEQYIVRKGWLLESDRLQAIRGDIERAIQAITWPQGADGFYLDPGSRKGNGVKPIKEACIAYLRECDWHPERRLRPRGVAGTGPLDLVRATERGLFGLEWETGNISSSHRAINKLCLGILDGELVGGALIVPSDALYPYLTDRVGNYRELQPYLSLWTQLPFVEGVLMLIIIEHDGLRSGVPHLPKGTDGRALI